VTHRFIEVLEMEPDLQAVAIDMPIGLLEHPQAGGRQCDREARLILGRPRASSVFSPPLRGQLRARVYGGHHTRGLSRQSFGILPKIREVDDVLCQRTLGLVREAHPELAFGLAAGKPMRFNKKTEQGRRERKAALRKLPMPWAPILWQVLACGETCYRRGKVGRDDLIDAAILSWTATRIVTGQARSFPAVPPVDGRGRPMAIWY
jgi:predicted RNase H-like nuclease